MFLGELNDVCKKAFWRLSNYMIAVDSEIEESEMAMLNEYKKELRCNYEVEKVSAEEASEILKELSTCDSRTKKIIYFELLGLAYADADYAKEEKSAMRELQSSLGVSDSEVAELTDCVAAIMDTYKRLGSVLNG